MADYDFFDFGVDTALNFDYGNYGLDTPSFQMPAEQDPVYSFGNDLTFDFQMPEFTLQQTSWNADDWLNRQFGQEPSFALGGTLAQPGAYNAVFGPGYNAFGGESRISQFDPSTGTYFDTAGNPVTPQSGRAATGAMTPGSQVTEAMDPEAFARQGSMSPYGSAAGYGVGAGAATQPGQAAPAPGAPGGGGGWMDTINAFLKSPLGGLLGAGAIGAAGMGVGRALAGPTPNAPTPSLAPGSPVLAQGQNTVAQMLADQAQREAAYQAEQAPGYQGIRRQAMTLIPGQLNPVTVENYQDPIQAGIAQELRATMAGQSNPMVEDQIRKDFGVLQNTMFRRLGPDWELSQPGQEALQAFNRNANMARYQSRSDTIRSLSPLEESRGKFAYQAPVEKAQALGGEQRAYVDTLSRTSALGRMDPFQLQTGLGGNPDQYRAMMTQLGFQGSTAGFNTQNQERRDIMAGTGAVAGTLAGQVGNLGNSDRLAKAIRDAQGGAVSGAPNWGSWGA